MIDFFGEFTFDSEFVGGGESAFSLDVDIKPSDEEAEDYTEAPNKEATASEVNAPLQDEDAAVQGEVYNTTDENGNTPIVEGSDAGNVTIKGLVVRKNSLGVTFFQVVLEAITELQFSGSSDVTLSNGLAFQSQGATVNFNLNSGAFTGGSFAKGGRFSFGRRSVSDSLYDIDDGIAIEPTGAGSFTTNDDATDLESVTLNETGKITVNGDYKFDFIDPNDTSATVNVKNATGDVVVQYTSAGDTVLDLSGLTSTGNNTISVVSAGGADLLVPPSAENALRISGTTYAYDNESGKAQFILNSSGAATGFVFGGNDDQITVPKDASFTYQDEDGTTLTFGVAGSSQAYTIIRQADDVYEVQVFGSAVVSDSDTTLTFTTAKALDTAVSVYFDDAGNILSVDGLDNLGTNDAMAVVESKTVTAGDEGLAIGDPTDPTGTISYISVSSGDFTYSNEVVTVNSGDTIYSLSGYNLASTGDTVTDVNGVTYTYDGNGYFVYDDEAGITGFVFTTKGDSITVPTGSGIDLFYLDQTTTVTIPAITDTDSMTITLSDVSTATAPLFEISELDAGSVFPAAAPFTDPITSEDTNNVFTTDINGNIKAIDNFTSSGITLAAGEYAITINGDYLSYKSTSDLTAVANGNNLVSVSGLTSDDVIYTGTADSILFQFATDANGDGTFTVNGKIYTVDGDSNKIVYITGGGVVTDLDEDATLTVTEGPVTVNGKEYTAAKIDVANETGEEVIGFTTKGGNLSSFLTDAAHPIVTKNTELGTITDMLGLPDYGDQVFTESANETMDQSSNSNRAEVILDDDGTATAAFNDRGKNLALVTGDGVKNIDLGDGGDAVIVRPGAGDTANSLVSVVGGAGNDSVVVQSAVPVYFDMADGGADKLITYAAANGRITLDHYDETSGAGVAIHDPQIESVKDLSSAIDEGMLLFQDGRILSIDRDEAADGTDRITDITVNNKNSNHQTMVRLFGYKDNGDSYGDDDGQLVGFTGKDGGILDASDIEEDLILVGNKDGNHNVGSALVTGVGNDTVYAGAGDSVNAGAGSNQIRLTDDSTRQAATVVVGQGLNTITGLQTGFNGDVLDISAVSSLGTIEYEDGLLTIADETTKSTTAAAVSTEADYIAQTFINDNTVMKAAIAKDGGTIDVTDTNAPNYFVAEDGAINFAQYSGDVNVDVDGDWVGTSVGGESATLLSGFSSLIGGSGNTLFKGGEHNEVLIAGTGESSLYGAGGRNVLVGSTSDSKFGSTEFFVQGIKNGAQNTITNFEFIEDNGSNTATFDNLNLGMADNNDVTDIKVNSDGSVSLAIKGAESGHTEKVTIEGAAGKEFLVDRGTTSESVVQIAATEVTINNDYVDFYAATDDAAGATVKVGDVTSTEVWLGGPPADHDKKVPEFTSSRFTVIDATGSSATAIMAGNELSNTIYGGLGNASMWGGEGNANDVMFGGSAHNEFYYEVGNGNDTIMSANEGDIIHLGATLDQVDFDNTNISASGIEVKFTDGGKLNINSGAEVTFSFDDGTAIKANRQTNQFE